MDCDVVVNMLLLTCIVVLELDCNVMLNVLLLIVVVVLEIDCDVMLNVLLLHLVVDLEVLLLPLHADHDAASYAAAEHYEWPPQWTTLALACSCARRYS